MKKIIYRILIGSLLISGLAVMGCSKDKKTTESKKSNLVWHKFNEGLILAKKEKKRIFIDFSAEWCKYCHKLDAETFSDPRVEKVLKEQFICIRIKTDEPYSDSIIYKGSKPMSPSQFFQAIGGTGLPTLIFLDENGEFIDKIGGFLPADSFLPIFKFLGQKCDLKNISYKDYLSGKAKDCN